MGYKALPAWPPPLPLGAGAWPSAPLRHALASLASQLFECVRFFAPLGPSQPDPWLTPLDPVYTSLPQESLPLPSTPCPAPNGF